MPIIRTLTHHPYPTANAITGSGVRTSHLNEVIDSVLNEQYNGALLCSSGTKTNGNLASFTMPVIGQSMGGSLNGTINVKHVGEILPGYNYLIIRASLRLYYTTGNAVIMGVPVTLTGGGPINFIFTLTNNVTGVSAVIARFFLNETALSNQLATLGLPPLVYPAGYATNVSEGDSITTFIVPFPASLNTSAVNNSDHCTLNIAMNSPYNTTWGLASAPMLRHFEVIQIKDCNA